jgi:hypothetical protein
MISVWDDLFAVPVILKNRKGFRKEFGIGVPKIIQNLAKVSFIVPLPDLVG